MSKINYHTDFKTLRQAYLEVKNFVETESTVSIDSLDAKLEKDLGMSGYDNLALLEKFVTKYKLNTDGFDYSKHFMSEGELHDNGAIFLKTIVLPIALIALIIQLASFNKSNLKIGRLFSFWKRETADLSFGDLLTWYLTSSFNLRDQVKVVI